jgi:steroid delta-isomerase-like uncharacterized protein
MMDESILGSLANKFLQGLNGRDATGLARLYTEDGVMYNPDGVVAHGREEIEKGLEPWFRAFPDFSMEFPTVLISGNHLVLEFDFNGTQTGAMESPTGEIPPTGRPVNLKGVMIFRVSPEGLVEEDRTYMDMASFLTQLGLMD